jgi:carboxyl-terminal processing protease
LPTKNLKILAVALVVCVLCYGNAVRYRTTRDLGLAMNIIEQAYVDPADPQQLYQAAMSGMMKSLDPNSGYIAAERLPSFQSIFEQQFGGLGVSLDGPPRRPQYTVMTTLFNSPAFKAGLRPGDILLAVDGEEVSQWTMDKVSEKLRGREGTPVSLRIERLGESIDKSIIRGRIEVESVIGDRRRADGSWEYLMQADPRIAYVRVELFGEKTASELQRAIQSCQPQPQAIIIDLRDNSGGLLLSATQICDMFLEDGQIVTTRGRNQRIDEEIHAQKGAVVADSVPIAIIVNENSASASEVVAACLKDRQRGFVVGMRSFGKGSVQNVIPLEGGRAAMRLTTAYYYPPSGRRIHRRESKGDSDSWGVDPSEDCQIDLNEDELAATIERFRMRSDPLSNGSIPSPAHIGKEATIHEEAELPPPHENQIDNQIDASLPRDAQLYLAFRKLQEQLGP